MLCRVLFSLSLLFVCLCFCRHGEIKFIFYVFNFLWLFETGVMGENDDEGEKCEKQQ